MAAEFPYLEVFATGCRLWFGEDECLVFEEGAPSAEARARYAEIRTALQDKDVLSGLLKDAHNPSCPVELPDDEVVRIQSIVASINQGSGRAIAALTFMQAVIKHLQPSQNIRLHKGGGRGSDFSWKEGLSMRVLDKSFFTPFLRSAGLLSLNTYGLFMTRSLAENYPFSQVYKAQLVGPRSEWLDAVDFLELNPGRSRDYAIQILRALIQRSEEFAALVGRAMDGLNAKIESFDHIRDATQFLIEHIDSAPQASRVLEVVVHAFFQALDEMGRLEGYLQPLGQMRQANKKHKNVGDIETVDAPDSPNVVLAWDAKYGKPYLRDELDELAEKLAYQTTVEMAGFVTECQYEQREDVVARLQELEACLGTHIMILSIDQLVELYAADVPPESRPDLSRRWIRAYVESMALIRRDLAPIDEPTAAWLEDVCERLEAR